MCLAQEPQRSDTAEARTRGPSVSSQHSTTALPNREYDQEITQSQTADKPVCFFLFDLILYIPSTISQL